jgi:hypothetical protein
MLVGFSLALFSIYWPSAALVSIYRALFAALVSFCLPLADQDRPQGILVFLFSFFVFM